MGAESGLEVVAVCDVPGWESLDTVDAAIWLGSVEAPLLVDGWG
jgi:hypothetical protein